MDKILTAENYAKLEGHPDIKSRIVAWSRRAGKPWTGKLCNGPSVSACVDWGRWIAKCECGGAEVVSQDYPWFYCCSCGNENTEGMARPVRFPGNMSAIEAELSQRPAVHNGRMYVPSIQFGGRNWEPGETVADLRKQRQALEKVVGAK